MKYKKHKDKLNKTKRFINNFDKPAQGLTKKEEIQITNNGNETGYHTSPAGIERKIKED